MKVPNFLIQDRHAGYQFRRKIPSDLRPHFSNKREIRRSLRTHHRGTAIRLARLLAAQTDKLFEELMRMTGGKKDITDTTAALSTTAEAPPPAPNPTPGKGRGWSLVQLQRVLQRLT